MSRLRLSCTANLPVSFASRIPQAGAAVNRWHGQKKGHFHRKIELRDDCIMMDIHDDQPEDLNGLLTQLAGENYCYVTTTGRVSGNPH